MLELPIDNPPPVQTLELEDLENLKTRWLNEDHFFLLGDNGSEKLYCRVEGECTGLDQCIYQPWVNNTSVLDLLDS